MHLPHRSLSVGLTVALVVTAVATLIRTLLTPILGSYAPHTIYLLGVVATAWVGGFWPGVAATLLGYLAGEVFFIHPYGSTPAPFSVMGPSDLIRFISYALIGVAFSFVSEQWHRVRLRDLTRAQRLEEEVAERLRATESLRQAKQTLEALVAAAPIPIVVIDPDRTVRLWNRAAEQVFGWKSDEVLGRELPIVPDAKSEECHAARQAVTMGHSVGPIPTARLRKDGSLVDVELSAAPLYSADSLVDSMVLLLHDVTEQRRAERSLRESQELLREADRRKDAFLATLAHELRNPLAPIRNGLQIMRLAEEDPSAIERTRAIIERQLAQMVRLIDDLLDVSRITRGTIELRRHRMHLQDAILSAVETTRPLIDTNRHDLRITLPEEPIAMDADLTRLAQAFANVLHNAAKYTEPGGRIALVAERLGSRAVVRVVDNGIGIEPELLPRIFGLFMQADPAQKAARGGLGVGLSLVKQLIEGHGGTITAHSEGLGRGSEFVIMLPVALSAPAAPVKVLATPAATPRRRVLVVDDNEDSVESLRALIELMGHDCATALDGPGAIAKAYEYRPDMILLDIGMPGMNGNDACRAIRSEPWGHDIHMVALTGWGQAEDRERTRAAGFDRHLVKPVEPAVLAQVLAEAVPGAVRH